MTPDERRPAADRPRRRADVVFRRVGDDWLLFDPRTQRIHVLNLTAALVWSFLEGERSLEEIEAGVREAFAEGGEAAEPARAALARFAEEGLLEPARPEG